MPTKSWTLLDVDDDIYLDSLYLGANELTGAAAGMSVRKRRLRGGLRDGVDRVEIDNGRFAVRVLPTRGMGLWWANTDDGLDLGWNSPANGPVHPRSVNPWEPSGLGWLSGFDELLCRCGLESNGGPVHDKQGKLIYPLHGKIANTPAHKVTLSVDEGGEIMLQGVVDEARLYHPKLRLTSTLFTRPGELGVRIIDEVQNLSAEPAEMELLYHVNFGPPLLDSGAKTIAPVKTLVPMTPRAAEGIKSWDTYGPAETSFTEQVYLFELAADSSGKTRTLLRNAHGNLGASLVFDVGQLPCFTVWKSTQMAADGYVTGLEPGVNYPNQRPFEAEQGRVVKLAGGERRTIRLAIEAHPDAKSVAAAEGAIAAIQKGTQPKIYDRPTSPWAPA